MLIAVVGIPAQVHAAEATSSQLTVAEGDGGHGYATRTLPPFRTQLDALFGRAVLNVIRDPYLAWLHVLLTIAVALVIGTLFPNLKSLNRETAGIQVMVPDQGNLREQDACARRTACVECRRFDFSSLDSGLVQRNSVGGDAVVAS